jgi:hypothetical protein
VAARTVGAALAANAALGYVMGAGSAPASG